MTGTEALQSAPGVLGRETPVDAVPNMVPPGSAGVEHPSQAVLLAVARAQAGLSEWPDICDYHRTNVPNNDRGAIMTASTPEEAPDCVDSTIFDEVELNHHWTLQPPLPDYRNIHRSISTCSWCGSSLNEEYAGNSLLRAFLSSTDGTRVYWRSNGDGGMEPCSSTVYSRVCRRCGHPAGDGVLCTRCANR